MWARVGSILLGVFLFPVLFGCGDGNDEADFGMPGDWSEAPAMDYDAVDGEFAEAEESLRDESMPLQTIGAGSIERRVIRNGELELVVSDVNAAVRHARDTVADYDGYVESSSSRTLSDGDELAELSLEVPYTVFDDVMNALANGPQVIRVERESTSSRDVTEEYVDLQSRLGNLRSTEQRFVELLAEANTIDEILRVEGEISRTRGEIERIQGRINYLDQRTNYSRIYAYFYTDDDSGLTVGGQHFTPGESARNAWNASMEFMGAIGNAAVTIVVFFWWAWPLLGILIVVAFGYRRRSRQTIISAPPGD